MKRIISVLIALAMLLSACLIFASCGKTDEKEKDLAKTIEEKDDYDWKRCEGTTLNVYNWGEYISDGVDDTVDVLKEFTRATDVTALAVTKLDGTAKGGVVIGISDQFKIPIKFIGVGEKIDDLKLFDKKEFVESLFD